MKEHVATGRRKTAVASVRVREGKGSIDVNGRPFEQYFPNEIQRKTILEPIEKAGVKVGFDILIRVNGGGLEAQATAVRLGLSRALIQENDAWKPNLKDAGFLTRDGRKKERKKYGRAGARKRFQFSKR